MISSLGGAPARALRSAARPVSCDHGMHRVYQGWIDQDWIDPLDTPPCEGIGTMVAGGGAGAAPDAHRM